MFRSCGLSVEEASYLGGMLSTQASNLWRWLIEHAGLRIAWMVTFPLRGLMIMDGLVRRITHHPAMAIAMIGRKQEATASH